MNTVKEVLWFIVLFSIAIAGSFWVAQKFMVVFNGP